MTADAAPPQLSPDGYWWWTGTEWIPAAQLFSQQLPELPRQVQAQDREQTQPEQAQPEQAQSQQTQSQQTQLEPVHAYAPAEQYVAQPYAGDQYVAQPATTRREQSWQQLLPGEAATPVQQLPVFEILPAGAAPAPKPSRGKAVIASVVAAVLVIGAGAAYGVNHFLGGGGQQPEDVLPANAVAMVKVDLDPSIGQKAAIYRFSRSFPQLHLTSADRVKDDLLRPLFSDGSMNYDRDIKPWLGDRAAVAAVPDGSPDGFAPVAAVQYTDKAKAKRTLLAESMRSATDDDPMFFAFSGDYAILATSQAAADQYAKATMHLTDNDSYTNAVDALDGDQIAVAWADLARVYKSVPAAALRANPFWGKLKAAPTGAFVVGAHAASDYLEVQGKAVDVAQGLTQIGAAQFGHARTANLIGSFPNDTVVAFEATGLGDVVSKAYAALPPVIKDATDGLGLKMPGDLAAILGTDTAVGLTGSLTAPQLIAKVKTANPVAATRALEKLSRTMQDSAPWCPCDGPALTTTLTAKSGYVVTSDPKAKTRGTLGSTPSFTRAVPDAKTAGMVLYVSLKALPPEMMRDVQGLDAVGMTVDGNGAFRLRLTAR